MKKSKTSVTFGMSMLFAAIVFCSLTLACWVSVYVLYFLVQHDIVELAASFEPYVWPLLTVLLMVCFPVGVVVAFAAIKLPLKPIRELIDAMDRLASGEFDTRINVGRVMKNYPPFVDICESFNRMAQELENTGLLRVDFINNFSHEFRTPIASIAGFARLLRRDDLTDAQREEYLSIIEEECHRLSHISTSALNLSKLEKVEILTDVTTFDLSEQLRSCVLLLETRWSQKGLGWDMDFEEFQIRGNEEMLKQVWINLVDNAVKFSDRDGVIGLDVTRQGQKLTVSITNTGPEIPEHAQQRIFHKFYQVDESHSGEGNGIGLAIVKRVVELHRGEVWMESGNGQTTFVVELPVSC